MLSVPMREYFQASGWAEPAAPPPPPQPQPQPQTRGGMAPGGPGEADMRSVRTGSDFWAGGHETESSSMFTAELLQPQQQSSPAQAKSKQKQKQTWRERDRGRARNGKGRAYEEEEDEGSSDSDGTQIAGEGGGVRPALAAARARGGQGQGQASEVVDEVGAQDAFVAGMMWALTRRLLPGEPYTPSAANRDASVVDGDQKGRWRQIGRAHV